MHDERLGPHTTRSARSVMLVPIAAAVVLLTALAMERMHFLDANEAATDRIRDASAIAGVIRLEDEILTMSAEMAAATGDPAWVQRYRAHLPLIDSALTSALRQASNESGHRFELAMLASNDSLVLLERQAFAHVRAGNLPEARAVLESPGYATQKARLAAAQSRLLVELQAEVAVGALRLRRNSWMLILTLVSVTALGFALLWLRLNRDLQQSEAVFSAKQEEIHRLAMHDTLTGLKNRRYLQEELDRTVARCHRTGDEFAALVIDLDDFKPVNDRFGHAVGDQVLRTIAARLSSHVRRDELAARVGGDEFVVVLNRHGEDEGILRAAHRLIRAISEPIPFADGAVVRVGASIGIALFPDDATNADDLLRRADVAMYRAKDGGRGGVRFFQASMDTEILDRAQMEADLRDAIPAGQIVPYFQPLIDLQRRTLTGFECLARWEHPEHGVLGPDTFIHVAEHTRQIGAMTLVLLRAALREARNWDPSLTLAINIAPQMLEDDALVAQILGVLREAAFPPDRLEIEITESAFIRDLDTARAVITAFKAHGVSVALDDFGTGYSSLSHLSELPFDRIKIDRYFVSTMRDKPQSATIVSAIVGLGRSMSVRTTAEGIEHVDDEVLLRRLGCLSGQGFLYSRPVPAEDVPAFLEAFELARALHPTS